MIRSATNARTHTLLRLFQSSTTAIETTSLLSFPSSKPPPSQTLTRTHFRPVNPYSLYFPRTYISHIPIAIKSAISRAKREKTVKNQLENCYLLAAIKCTGFTVKEFQDLRRSLPESSKLTVAKNTLVYKAIRGTPWEVLKPCLTGMNAWLFVHTEEIPKALQPYGDFRKEKKLENDFTGVVFEGKFYGPGEYKQFETMPSPAEIYAEILGASLNPVIGLVGTIQASEGCCYGFED
ncbi:unnamed protein product [Dovyalis caffra]|uniref:Large ribosomal subunit protein uL10c n=1 Tax=Dovyalis caffra TaxID=77055 RepID=A0AAV1QXR4_9ROSI|nr:unnamed protein product [Dovyalis caffra]